MSTVQFRDLRTNDISSPLTLEEIFRRYGAWAGIHTFNFDKFVDVASASITGVSAGHWSLGEASISLPANFTVKYHKTNLRQGIYIYSSTGPAFFVVATDSNGYPQLLYNNVNNLVAQTIPKSTPEEADVEIVFRQQTFSDVVNPTVWQSITMYMNDEWITTFSSKSAVLVSNMHYGVCAYGTDQRTYTNIQVPELCDTAEFGTLDPGENAIGGLQRTTDGRYLKFFSRFDGSLRAWKKKQRDQIMVLESDLEGIKRSIDLPKLITHARMMGAYIWSEDKDDDLIRMYGHRFQEVNNSMLLTQTECLEEAGNTIKRSEEQAFTIMTQARHIPILEPEDRIEIDGEDWVIDGFSFTGGYGRLVQTYNCRRYVWG